MTFATDRGPTFAGHLGMLSPALIQDYREFLHDADRANLPAGTGGTPANLLCRELVSRGQRLTIFTLDRSVREEVVLEGPRLRICVGPLGGPPGRRPARDFFELERRWLQRAVARERPDLVHAQWTYLYALAAQACGLPHLITAHDAPLSVLRHDLIPYRVAHTLMAYRVLARAKAVVSVSPRVADHLRRYMLYRGEERIIPNGLPEAFFDRTARRPEPGRPVTFATLLNNWGRLKNGQAALRAFAEHRRRRPEDRLLMMGHDHGLGGPAQGWARAHGLEAGVAFLGPRPQGEALDLLAREVDVVVHPSREESFGMVLVEAGAMGLPVIAGVRSGAVPWTLDGGRAGVLVDVESPREIADAMLVLAEDPAGRLTWGARGRDNALRRFHVRAMTDAYVETYTRLFGARP